MSTIRRKMPWKFIQKNDVFILELFHGTIFPRTSPILPDIDSVFLWLDNRSKEFSQLGNIEPYGMTGNLDREKINLSECCERIKKHIKNGETHD